MKHITLKNFLFSAKKAPKKVLIGLSLTLIIGCLSVAYFFIKQPQQITQGALPIPTPPPKEVTNLLEDVGKKVRLPADETPNVATITNPAKLQDQAFFAKAKKGDKVLMYTKSLQAYLYRPSTDEIINNGTLEIVTKRASTSAELASSSAQANSPTILRVKF